jgi:hypothetical protein
MTFSISPLGVVGENWSISARAPVSTLAVAGPPQASWTIAEV